MSGWYAPPPIPERLVASCRHSPETMAWLARLPDVLRDLEERWSLRLGRRSTVSR
jgi:hypothetical protein